MTQANILPILSDVLPRGLLDGLASRHNWFSGASARNNVLSPHTATRTMILRAPAQTDDLAIWQVDRPLLDYPVLQDWAAMRRMLAAMADLLDWPLFGKIMIARLPAGATIGWHIDQGEYAERHARYHVPLATNSKAWLYSGGEAASPPVGQLTLFNNRVLHSAANFGQSPRMHLIIDVRISQ